MRRAVLVVVLRFCGEIPTAVQIGPGIFHRMKCPLEEEYVRPGIWQTVWELVYGKLVTFQIRVKF